jgi:hypothetical protein
MEYQKADAWRYWLNIGYSLKGKGFRMANCIIKIGKRQDLRYNISSLFFIDFLYAKRLFIENGWQ